MGHRSAQPASCTRRRITAAGNLAGTQKHLLRGYEELSKFIHWLSPKPLLRYGKRIAQNAIRSWLLPWRRYVHICRPKGIGDVLMCTPALRAFKQANPRCHIHFYTAFPGLVRGLPYLDEVSTTDKFPSEEASSSEWFPRRSMWMRYENVASPGHHLAKLMGESIGVRVNNVRPDCVVDEKLVKQFKSAWQDLPRPHILVQRQTTAWTINKNWPGDLWKTLITSLLETSTIIEIGETTQDHAGACLSNYIDLRGRTCIEELVACVAAADILVAPVSGPVHIASAVQTSAVVILGGYELPINTAYPGNKILYTPIECSPCWLHTPCPIDRECLRRISPENVRQAIDEIWEMKNQFAMN